MAEVKQTGLETQSREQWVTRSGFMLAAVGSAVGLGNIWGFSHALGTSGGAAFLLVYLIAIVIIGYPVMMAEFTIGRKAQSDAVGTFEKLAPKTPWFITGLLGVGAAFLIMAFYPVLGGMVAQFFVVFLAGGTAVPEASGPWVGVAWHLIFMIMTVAVVILGVKRGIEKANKFLMPLLAVMLFALAAYGLTLGGARDGLAFMFTPTWASLGDTSMWLTAIGQAFFSLSLGMGALITYSSYLKQQERLPGTAAGVVGMDTGIAILAGIMIFPAVFAFGHDPAGGGTLVFGTLPAVFGEMGAYGGLFGAAFFFLLGIAALSSAVSLLEVPVAYFMRRFNMVRQKATLVVATIMTIIGLPITFGVWYDTDFVYGIAATFLLPLGGLFICLFVGWGWNKNEALSSSDFGDSTLGIIWLWILRIVAPALIAILFVYKVIDVVKNGF